MPELLDFILAHEDAFKRGRLASLYSDFRIQQATNPDGYNANISAWRQALIHATRAGLVPSQTGANSLLSLGTGEALLRELTSKDFGRPLALAAVVVRTRHGQGAASSAVVTQASNHTSVVDRIYSLDSFRSAFAHALSPSHEFTPTDISVLLTHLSRDKAALSYDPISQTVKLAPANATATEPITQQDITIAHLRSLIASLNAQIPALTERIAACDATARAAATAATKTPAARTTALSALRSKKLAEQGLQRRADTLAQLEAVYAKIEAAADNVEVVRAMEASAGVLRGLHDRVGGAEGVEGVVEALREEMAKVDEVSDVVNEVGREGAGGVVDEDEVDEEFAALERAERERVEREEAEKTAARLREVERLEEERKVAEKAREEEKRNAEEKAKEQQARSAQEVKEEAEVLETSQELGRMSLDEDRPTESSGEQGKEAGQSNLVPAE
ncbi:putative snf7 family protein [Diplodia seriata]|uniref:Putative snf7 family protein n=1 Tax=Diplodia seriata TaxID=420778 RepID=A0A0G2H0Q1_9PEZI|nr:putative snf7 family protein [Diplodia seriata]